MTATALRRIGVGALILAAVASRFILLDRPSLYVDEFLHVTAAKAWITQGQPLLSSGHRYARALPYTAAVAGSFRVFGVNEWAARFPSAVAGIFLIILLLVVSWRWFGAATGFWAAGLVTVSPLCLEMARMCRMYAWLQVAYLAVVYGVWQWVLRPGPRLRQRLVGAVGATALLGVAVLLHSLALIFSVALGGYVLGLALRRPRSNATAWITAGIVAAAVVVASGWVDLGALWARANSAPTWAQPSRYYMPYYWRLWQQDFTVLMWLAIPLLGWLVWRYRALGWYLAVMIVIPFGLHSVVFDLKSYRYVAHLFPIFALAVSPGLAALGRRAWSWIDRTTIGHRPLARGLMTFAMALSAVLALWPAPARALGEIRRLSAAPAWRAAYRYVAAHRQPGEMLISSDPLAAAYYLGELGQYVINNYGWVDFRGREHQDAQGRWIDWYSGLPFVTSGEELARVGSAAPRGWCVINRDRFEVDAATPPDIREWFMQHGRREPATPDDSVVVYRWDLSRSAGAHE